MNHISQYPGYAGQNANAAQFSGSIVAPAPPPVPDMRGYIDRADGVIARIGDANAGLRRLIGSLYGEQPEEGDLGPHPMPSGLCQEIADRFSAMEMLLARLEASIARLGQLA